MPTQNPNMLNYCRCCGSCNFVESLEPDASVHYAALRCGDCGRFIKWIAKPRAPDVSIVTLLRGTNLESWERKFLKAVVCRSFTKTELIVIEVIQAKVNPVPCGRGSG